MECLLHSYAQQLLCFLLLFVIGLLIYLALLHQPIAEVHVGGGAFSDGVASLEDFADRLKNDFDIAEEGDLIITVGAGDIYKAGEKLLKEE